jgi:hypothetical protein
MALSGGSIPSGFQSPFVDSLDPIQAEISACLRESATLARVTDPYDAHGMVELFGHLRKLDKHLRSSAHRDASEVCEVGIKITEHLIGKHGPSAEELLRWVDLLLKFLGTTVGVELPEPPDAAVPAPIPFRLPESDADALRISRSDGLRLGEILVQMFYLKAEDVQRALEMQQKTSCRLGEALVKLGLLTQKGLDAVIRIQQRRRGPGR